MVSATAPLSVGVIREKDVGALLAVCRGKSLVAARVPAGAESSFVAPGEAPSLHQFKRFGEAWAPFFRAMSG